MQESRFLRSLTIKLPKIQLDQNRERIIPDPLMPIANSTKIPWTIIFVSFLVSYFIGMYLKDKKRVKNVMSISWFLLPLLIFSWIFTKGPNLPAWLEMSFGLK